MLDERSLRKPTFDEANSRPVKMGDGQTWHLPKPFVRVRPQIKDRKVEGTRVTIDDPEYAPLAEAVDKDDATVADVINLAAFLLDRNYQGLTDEDLGAILEFAPGDKSPDTWMAAVTDLTYGYGAKKA